MQSVKKLIEYLKAKAGENDYHRLINDTLQRIVREESHHKICQKPNYLDRECGWISQCL